MNKILMDKKLDSILKPMQEGLRQLQLLPDGLGAVAASSQFLPPALREALHDIAHLSKAALARLEQGMRDLVPYVSSLSVSAKRLENVIADYSVQMADLRADHEQLAKVAAIRLLTSALQNASRLKEQHRKADIIHPSGHVAVVCTAVYDMQGVRHWNNRIANEALGVLSPVLRRLLKQHGGFEYDYDGDGGFTIVFPTPHEALRWCCAVQPAVQRASWPLDLFEMPSCRRALDADGNLLFSGLRVQMGLCTGAAETRHNVRSGAVEYSAALVNQARAVVRLAMEGEILVAEEAYNEITRQPMTKVPTGGIAWIHRKEYMIFGNAAQLLRTALPTELLNRRSLYAREGAQPSPLVAVAEDDWAPLDAPHQREELERRHIHKRSSTVALPESRDADVLATLRRNAHFQDMIRQLAGAAGVEGDAKADDPISTLAAAIGAVSAMSLRLEALVDVAGDRHHVGRREERRRSSGPGPLAALHSGRRRESIPMLPGRPPGTDRTDPDAAGLSPEERAPKVHWGDVGRSLSPATPTHRTRQTSSESPGVDGPSSSRHLSPVLGLEDEHGAYRALDSFSFARLESANESDKEEQEMEMTEDAAEPILFTRDLSAPVGGSARGSSLSGARRGSSSRAGSLREVLQRLQASHGSAFGSSLQTRPRGNSSSSPAPAPAPLPTTVRRFSAPDEVPTDLPPKATARDAPSSSAPIPPPRPLPLLPEADHLAATPLKRLPSEPGPLLRRTSDALPANKKPPLSLVGLKRLPVGGHSGAPQLPLTKLAGNPTSPALRLPPEFELLSQNLLQKRQK